MFASKAIGGRPVKWIESRRENYQSTTHGRDHITYLEIAGTARRRGHRPAGQDPAPTSAADCPRSARASRPRSTAACCRAATRSRTSTCEVTGVYTNTDVRRRLPRRRPARGDVRHRARDGPVRGRDRHGPGRAPPQELHRQPDQFPYENPSGLGTASGGAKIYIDSGDYEPAWTRRSRCRLRATSRAKKAEATGRGKLLGIGLSTYIEVCGVAPSQVDRRRRRGLGRGDVGDRPTSRST